MYKSYIFQKHGHLGAGVRKKVHQCVYCYVTEMFPPEDGSDLMGHREA